VSRSSDQACAQAGNGVVNRLGLSLGMGFRVPVGPQPGKAGCEWKRQMRLLRFPVKAKVLFFTVQ
jgi:hypothetical protein